jgi:transposase
VTAREQLIRPRMGMLALADQLQNISAACKRAGIGRSHYYEIKAAFEKYGRDGLAPHERRRPRMPNETPPELVEKILEMTAKYPTYSYNRISQQLRLVGVGVSPPAVRGVLQRQGLTLRHRRLLWLEQKTAADGGVLTEAQLRLLRMHRGRSARTPTSSARSRASARSTSRPWSMRTARWPSPSSTCRRSS